MDRDVALGGVVLVYGVRGASGVVITASGLEDVPSVC